MDKKKELEHLKELEIKKTLELESIQKEIKSLEKELALEKEEKKNIFQDNDEILKEIDGYPRFFINRKGQVFHEAGMEMPVSQNDNGNFVTIFDEKNTKVEVSVSELVARAWITEKGFPGEIEHLDGDIYNDHADNLKLK